MNGQIDCTTLKKSNLHRKKQSVEERVGQKTRKHLLEIFIHQGLACTPVTLMPVVIFIIVIVIVIIIIYLGMGVEGTLPEKRWELGGQNVEGKRELTGQ
jgi:hypothetical protein